MRTGPGTRLRSLTGEGNERVGEDLCVCPVGRRTYREAAGGWRVERTHGERGSRRTVSGRPLLPGRLAR